MNLAKAIVGSMPKPQDTIKPRWATVVSVVPLRIRFDGEDNPLNLTPVDLVGVSLNDRVWCQLYAGQVLIVGKFGGVIPAGSVQAFAGVNIPAGWLKANGATYNTADYPALAAALGETGTTFNVPQLSGRVIVGATSSDADFNLGVSGGAKTHTLSVSEMPSHNHSIADNKVFGDKSGGFLGSASTGKWINTLTGLSTNDAGGGQAHNNVQPYLALNWIIKT